MSNGRPFTPFSPFQQCHSAARFCTYMAPVISKLLSGCFSLASGVRAPLATCCRCCHRHRHQQCIASMTDESHKFTTLPRRVSYSPFDSFQHKKKLQKCTIFEGGVLLSPPLFLQKQFTHLPAPHFHPPLSSPAIHAPGKQEEAYLA